MPALAAKRSSPLALVSKGDIARYEFQKNMSTTADRKTIGTMAKTGENCPESGTWEVSGAQVGASPATSGSSFGGSSAPSHQANQPKAAPANVATPAAKQLSLKKDDKMPQHEGKPVTWKLTKYA